MTKNNTLIASSRHMFCLLVIALSMFTCESAFIVQKGNSYNKHFKIQVPLEELSVYGNTKERKISVL